MTEKDDPDARFLLLPAAITGELSLALDTFDPPSHPEPTPADLAALVEGGLDVSASEALLRGAEGRALAEAAGEFIDAVGAGAAAPPARVIEAARAALIPRPGAEVIPLRRPPPIPANSIEIFQLLAAASSTDDASIICRSQSGIWTLEVFVGQSAEDRAAGRGVLLLSVHPEHQAGYEGRTARVFVVESGEERVLAEDRIAAGELYADIVLTGLDLRRRDAISVVFGAGPDDA